MVVFVILTDEFSADVDIGNIDDEGSTKDFVPFRMFVIESRFTVNSRALDDDAAIINVELLVSVKLFA
jgi:hypothetical protein